MIQGNSDTPRWRANKELFARVQSELARRELESVPTAELVDVFLKLGKAVRADDKDYRKGRFGADKKSGG